MITKEIQPTSRSRRRAAAIGAAMLFATLTTTIAAPAASALTCRPYTVIGVRGTHDGAQDSIGKVLPAAVARIQKHRGKSKVTVDHASYRAGFWWWEGGYEASVKEGRRSLKAKVAAYVKNCPKTRIILLGYSQGAHVVGDAIVADLSKATRKHISAVGLFGDPRFNPDLRGSFSSTAQGGVFGKRPSWPSGMYIVNACNKQDNVCGRFTSSNKLGPGHASEAYKSTKYSPIKGRVPTTLLGDMVAKRN